MSAVLTQISWTNHLLILSKTKTKEEREFYLASLLEERYRHVNWNARLTVVIMTSFALKKKVSAPLTQIHPKAPEVFKDTYIFIFLISRSA